MIALGKLILWMLFLADGRLEIDTRRYMEGICGEPSSQIGVFRIGLATTKDEAWDRGNIHRNIVVHDS
jgi:hypothetical protein